MSASDWVGLAAVVVFAVLVAFLARVLVKAGHVLDQLRDSIKEVTVPTVQAVEETATTVATANAELVKVGEITTSAVQISQNASALTGLYAATLGQPLVKIAAFSYGVRRALGRVIGRDGRKVAG